jgi:hypothetical protein
MSAIRIACVFWILVGLSVAAHAGDLDRYHYVIAKSVDRKVCQHMAGVYNSHFGYPWRLSVLRIQSDDLEYGTNGRYAYPKLPGVTHDNEKTFQMARSRLPTSPEFDAIEWREGRYSFGSGSDLGELPMLVAKIDIDNDGRIETVMKTSFMTDYYISSGSGGEDLLLVFKDEEIDLGKAVRFEPFYRMQESREKPALITALPSVPYRLIRPFVLNGVTYLSGYQQGWSEKNSVGREEMHVVRYRKVSENPDPVDKRNIVHLDLICVFRMTVQRSR